MPSDAGNSSSTADRDYDFGQGSTSSHNGVFYQNFLLNNDGDGNPFDKSGGKGDGDENGSPKPEDLEVRMDLTDDLLHMVYTSFIIY